MFVILNVSTGSKEKGFIVEFQLVGCLFCSMFVGPITGVLMNPARTIGPSFW